MIISGQSSFSANQYAPTNISIVNVAAHREFSEDSQGNGGANRRRSIAVTWKRDSEGNLEPSLPALPDGGQAVAGGVHNGVGFMFRVDNMVIYNSQVKMFNQNSENISPGGDGALNATTDGQQANHYPHQSTQSTTPPLSSHSTIGMSSASPSSYYHFVRGVDNEKNNVIAINH